MRVSNSRLTPGRGAAYVTDSMAKPRLALTILDPVVIDIVKARQKQFRAENGVAVSLAQIAIMMITQNAKQNDKAISSNVNPE